MDLDYILNNRLIDKYLAGTLSADELAEFEEQLLWSSNLLAEVELTEKLRQGIRDVAESGELSASANAGQRRGLNTFLASPRYSLAASVLLLVTLSTTGVLVVKEAAEPGFPQAGMQTRIHTLDVTRGNSTAAPAGILPAGSEQEWVVLTLDPGPNAYERYRLSLYRQPGRTPAAPLWQLENARSGDGNLLAFGVPGSLLAPGDYGVIVEGWREDTIGRSDYEFVTEVHFRADSAE